MGNGWYFWRKSSTKRKKIKEVERERSSPTPGCMGSMFQHLNFSGSKSHYFIQDELTTTKVEKLALEAPKNSPVKEETPKAKEILPTPKSIQIKTNGGSDMSKIRTDTKLNDISLNLCSSPSANTPNLVARLMGLDHLPESFSPSLLSLDPSKISKSHHKEFICRKIHSINGRYSLDIDIYGCRSLPESPRVSTSRRSDVDQHRLSFQSCKETISKSMVDDFEPLRKNKKMKKDNGREGLGRKFGTNISNNVRNKEQRRDHVLLTTPKKPSEKKNKENQVTNSSFQGPGKDKKVNIKKKIAKSEAQPLSESLKRTQKPSNIVTNKKEEIFVRKVKEIRETKLKKKPISGQILNMSVTSNFPVKKEPLSPTKIPEQLSKESEAHSSRRRKTLTICLGKPYNPLMTCHGKSNGATEAQFHYIIQMLKFLGIDENTPISLAKLHSSSHPLHPSVFNCLELTFSGSKDSEMCYRSNRKLIFELVDEILVDILKPYRNSKPWVFSSICSEYYQRDVSLLIDQLFAKIRRFQAVDCSVLEDIDQLINEDLQKSNLLLSVAFEEESETIVEDLETYIMNSLLYEIVADVLFC